jgi:hypothetical protein
MLRPILTAEQLHQVHILYFSAECHNSVWDITILFCKYFVDKWEFGLAKCAAAANLNHDAGC